MRKNRLCSARTMTSVASWLLVLALLASCGAPLAPALPGDDAIVLGEKIGDVGYIDQPGSEIRDRLASRVIVFEPRETHYFTEEDYLVTVCRTSDMVVLVQVGSHHPDASRLKTAGGAGFATSRDDLFAALGPADDQASFSGYVSYFYDGSGVDRYTSFGYLTDDVSGPEDIAVGEAGCV